MQVKFKNIFKISSLAAALIFTTTSFAINYESVETLKNIAKDFVAKNVSVGADEKIDLKVGQTDQMRILALCDKPIESAFPADANRDQVTAIELTCNGASSWRTLVPVNLTISTNVVVAKRTISAHETISADDLDFAQHDRNRLYNGYYQDPKVVVGRVASEVILAGTVINKKNVQQPILVHRNQVVELIARTNTITVKMKGIARSDGRLNEAIQAYNPSSKRTIDAVVIDANQVEVIS